MVDPAEVRHTRAKLDCLDTLVGVAFAKLRRDCPHPTPTLKYCGSSGNWDRSDDAYWIEWHCPDCDLHWTTSQERQCVAAYPNATVLT